jgi:hypothetical protein
MSVFYLWGIGKIFLRSFKKKGYFKESKQLCIIVLQSIRVFGCFAPFLDSILVLITCISYIFESIVSIVSILPDLILILFVKNFFQWLADRIISLDLTNDHKIPNMFAKFSFFVVSHTLNSIIYNHFRTLSISTSQYRSMSTL